MGTRWLLQCLVLAASPLFGVCHGQQSLDSTVVVLSNWGVIRGQITVTAEGLCVRTDLGSTAELRHDQIACVAESIDAAYVQLLGAINPADTQSLEQLFDWCLRNGVANRAAELLVIGEARINDPAVIQRMHRRLDSFEIEGRRSKNQVWPSDVERVVEKPRASQKEIDDVIKSLPDDAEAIFNKQLHSKLILGCAAAKCHSRDSESLALWHHGKGIATPRGLTRHNLHQVMQFIDRDNPANSKILEMAQTAHGGQSKPSFDRSNATFVLLQNWTYAVGRHPEKYWTEVVQNANPQHPVNASAIGPPAAPEGSVSQVGFVESLSTPLAPPQTASQPESQWEAPPTDPCDPILFNRRHHPQRKQ